MKRPLPVLCLVLAATVAACGEDREAGEVRVETTGTGTSAGTGTTTTPQTSVPEGVIAQYATIEEEVAAEGGEQDVGPWRIAFIVEPAEGWFEQVGGGLRWRGPAQGETNHIEILPIEKATGRLVPQVPVTLEVLDSEGKRVERKPLSFYYAEFFHYANNFSLPGSGRYTLKATIGAPPFRRHGERSDSPALSEGAEVEFSDVEIDTEG
jgi:Fe2+ transport protein